MTTKQVVLPSALNDAQCFISLFLGSKGSGKSYLMMRLFNTVYSDQFDVVIIICPTYISQRNKYTWLKLKTKADIVVYNLFNIKFIESLVECVPQNNKERILIILDDCISQKGWGVSKSSDENALVQIAIAGGHKRISLWIASQSLRAISTTLRSNSDNIFLFKFNNTQEIEKYSSFTSYSKRKFIEIYNKVIKSKPYPFLLIQDGEIYNKFTLIEN